MTEQAAGHPRVFAGHQVALRDGLSGTRGDVTEVAERRGHDPEPTGRAAVGACVAGGHQRR